MEDMADAKFPFRKNRWIQRNFIPGSERIARFDAKGALLDSTAKSFHCVLDGKTEPMRETELDLLCKLMIRPVRSRGRVVSLCEFQSSSSGQVWNVSNWTNQLQS
jgi:hypothetical protein